MIPEKTILEIATDSFDDNVHLEETRVYATEEYSEFYTVRPLLTLYRPGEPIVSIKFPFAENADDRLVTLNQAAWCSVFFSTMYYRFIIDTYVPVKTPIDGVEMIDAIMMIRFNTKVCEFKVLPYSADGPDLTWLDPDIVVDRDLLTEKEELLTFAGMVTFCPSGDLAWGSYKRYLESKGFEFIYHGQYDESILGYFTRGLI